MRISPTLRVIRDAFVFYKGSLLVAMLAAPLYLLGGMCFVRGIKLLVEPISYMPGAGAMLIAVGAVISFSTALGHVSLRK
ncbi:MAG: hypothetical protein AB200_01305 [Parcubacteria bacterium C7867-005]|nr:MAG: hypothetical protein AB200_01305 [Parcubacteria bacterium C7867-005]